MNATTRRSAGGKRQRPEQPRIGDAEGGHGAADRDAERAQHNSGGGGSASQQPQTLAGVHAEVVAQARRRVRRESARGRAAACHRGCRVLPVAPVLRLRPRWRPASISALDVKAQLVVDVAIQARAPDEIDADGTNDFASVSWQASVGLRIMEMAADKRSQSRCSCSSRCRPARVSESYFARLPLSRGATPHAAGRDAPACAAPDTANRG